jgi:hypothetical protein
MVQRYRKDTLTLLQPKKEKNTCPLKELTIFKAVRQTKQL